MELVKGLFTSRRENAPSFVRANLSFKTEDFIDWLKNHTNAKGWCNIDILDGRDGKPYPKYNDWSPEQSRKEENNGYIGYHKNDLKDSEYLDDIDDIDEIDVKEIPF